MKITFLAFLKVALFYCTTKSQHLFHFSFELIAAIKWSNYKMTHLQTVYQGLYNTYIIFLQFSIFKTYCSSRVKEPSQFYPSKMFVRGQYFLGNACLMLLIHLIHFFWIHWQISPKHPRKEATTSCFTILLQFRIIVKKLFQLM